MGGSVFDTNKPSFNGLRTWGISLIWKIPLIAVVAAILMWIWVFFVDWITKSTVAANFWLGLGATAFLALAFIFRPGKEHIIEIAVLLGLMLTILSVVGDVFLTYVRDTLAMGWQGWYVLIGSIVLAEAVLFKVQKMR